MFLFLFFILCFHFYKLRVLLLEINLLSLFGKDALIAPAKIVIAYSCAGVFEKCHDLEFNSQNCLILRGFLKKK